MSIPKCPLGHSLALTHNGHAWICDGTSQISACPCGPPMASSVENEQRYRCTEGCDFDYCGKCYMRLRGTVLQLDNSVEGWEFSRKVDAALQQAKLVLDVEKQPQLASAVPHKYQNKYEMAEALTNAAMTSSLSCMDQLGMTKPQLECLVTWAQTSKSAVSLRLQATEHCIYLREETRRVDSAQQRSTHSFLGNWTSKTATIITEHVWRFTLKYEVLAYRGTGSSHEDILQLCSRSGSMELTTENKVAPSHERVILPNVDVNITYLVSSLAVSCHSPVFSIDQSSSSCHTPSKNAEVLAALDFFSRFQVWAGSAYYYLTKTIYPKLNKSALNLAAINTDGVFVPILPLLLPPLPANVGPDIISTAIESIPGSLLPLYDRRQVCDASLCLSGDSLRALHAAEHSSLQNKFADLESTFGPDSNALFTAVDAKRLVILMQLHEIAQFYTYGIAYIEGMLRDQLVAAVGKVLQPADFSTYMRYHNNKMFHEEYKPKPFCYAVRTSDHHAPEGVVFMDQKLASGSSIPDPIYTIVNSTSPILPTKPMKFILNAATNVFFSGERHVHAWLNHKFGGEAGSASEVCLTASARQFSSFIILLGRMSDANTFDPLFGAILQNKDELSIPLHLEMIPSAKEFKDSIESLSSQQQEFAKAFRGMQLENTLFAMCIINIKPHLEKLLNLAPDSLSKEIKLCQDLMMLFTEYQIPSDLLSFSGADNAGAAERVAVVKALVSSMTSMIDGAKQEELNEKRQKDSYLARIITVFVKSLTGLNAGIDVPANAPVAQLKILYSQSQGLPIEQITLIHEGTRLEDSQSLDECGIINESCVHLVTRLRGGPGADMGRIELSKGGGGGRGGGTSRVRRSLMATSSSSVAERGAPSPMKSAESRSAIVPPAPVPVVVSSSATMPTGNSGDATCTAPSQPDAALTSPEIDKTETDFDTSLKLSTGSNSNGSIDVTAIPKLLEQEFEKSDNSCAVRPTIITPGKEWSKRAQKSLLLKPVVNSLNVDDQKNEKNRAFELLDALSRSGGLPLDHTSLHVVIAATHCFESTIMDTLVKDNINPIDKVVTSTLLMAMTIHSRPMSQLIHSKWWEVTGLEEIQEEQAAVTARPLIGETAL